MGATRSYSELKQLTTYEERFKYLVLGGNVGEETFGHERSLNQEFYHTRQWRRTRRIVLLRDNNCDLGMPGHDIVSGLHIHHMNPVTVDDIHRRNPDILDPEFLISVTQYTHNAIHYGKSVSAVSDFTVRRPNDHVPWRASH